MATAVIIVNYRSYGELSRCLTSLAPHLRSNDEVAIVDYESDEDRLRQAVTGCQRAITVSRRENLGFAAGINLAASCTRAPFLLLLNPDTIVEGPLITVLEECLLSDAAIGVVGARVLNEDGTVQPTARRFPDVTTWLGGRSTRLTARSPRNWFSRRNLLGTDAHTPIDVDWLSGACLMTRRDVFERAGGFDESFFLYWEDADYCYRVARAGFRRLYIPSPLVRHAGGRSAERNQIRSIRAFHDSAYRLFRKQASPLGRLAAPLVGAGLWLRREWRVRQALRRPLS